MALILSTVRFASDVPSLEAVCRKITELTPMAVIVVESHPDESFEINARLACRSRPEASVDIKVLRQSHSAPNREVELLCRGDDPTLFDAAERALVALGGNSAASIESTELREDVLQTIEFNHGPNGPRPQPFVWQMRLNGWQGALVSLLVLPMIVIWVLGLLVVFAITSAVAVGMVCLGAIESGLRRLIGRR